MDYGLTIDNTKHLTIANISFFASNIDASIGNEAITFDSLLFKFPSSSHRQRIFSFTSSCHWVVTGIFHLGGLIFEHFMAQVYLILIATVEAVEGGRRTAPLG